MTQTEASARSRQDWRWWMATLAPAVLVFSALLAWAIARGIPIVSDDDLLRWTFAQDLFLPVPSHEGAYGWPAGHMLLIRGVDEALGDVFGSPWAAVWTHTLIGLGALLALGRMMGGFGAGRIAIITATLLFATSSWAVLLSLSMLAEMPNLLCLLLGFWCHWKALRPAQPRSPGRWLLVGDCFYALATSIRYESWPVVAMVGIVTFAITVRHRVLPLALLAALTTARVVLLSAFPVSWLAFQDHRFGDPFYFRTILASGSGLEVTAWEELQFVAITLPTISAGALVFLLLGAFPRPRQPIESRAENEAESAAVWLARLGLLLLFVIAAGEVLIRRGSNDPERYFFAPLALCFPLAGVWAEDLRRRVRKGLWLGVWWCAIGVSLALCVLRLATLQPFTKDFPMRFAAHVREVAEEQWYTNKDRLIYLSTWDRYPAPLAAYSFGHSYNVQRIHYIPGNPLPEPQGLLPPDTRFVITSLEPFVRRFQQIAPDVPVYYEEGDWWLLDFSRASQRRRAALESSPGVLLLTSPETAPLQAP